MKELGFLEELVECFSKLPGVGKKTALRYSYYILEKYSIEEVKKFADTLIRSKENIKHCNICGMFSDKNICDICNDPTRDFSKLIVVKDTKDALAIERLGVYNGLYHVLGGLISPLDGVGPDDINIKKLEMRCEENRINEIILATPFTPAGETTALFLEKILGNKNITISRIGYGIPAGGDIEYTDELTLMRSLQNRKNL